MLTPFWSVAPMIEAAPAPADGPGLAEIARESGASLEGLMLADGTLILKVERAGRARQVRIADGARFDPWRGSFVPGPSFGRDWPRLAPQRACARAVEDARRSGPSLGPGDGDRAGKTAREIAVEIWGAERVAEDWYPGCPLGQTVRRRVKRARYLRDAGYLTLAAQW